MQLQITKKGALYTAECSRCSATMYTHEWATWEHNERRDAMEAGTLRCEECGGTANPETFGLMPGRYYAARYSMPGYLDCTEWDYGRNRRALVRQLRDMYGPAEG